MAPGGPSAEVDDPAAPRRRGLDAETLYALLLVVLLGGLAAAGYAAYEVLNPAAAAVCSTSGTVSCAKVAGSGDTYLFGIQALPDYAVGIAGFLVMLVVAFLAYRTFDRRYLQVLAVLSGIALLIVADLVYTETFVIHAICPVCTTAHVLDGVTFGITLTLLKMSRPGRDDSGSDPARSEIGATGST